MDFDSVNPLITEDFRMSFGEVLNLVHHQELIIRPIYKVGCFWDERKRSRFIESALLGLPLNGFVFDQDDYGYYQIVDGSERLCSVYEYFNNGFKLKGLTILRELNGLYMSDLPYKNQVKLKRAMLSVTVLRRDSSQDLKCELYKRINVGKSGFEPQEARNYAYPDAYEYLSNLKKDLDKAFNFRITNQSHGKRKLKMSLKEDHFLLCLLLLDSDEFKYLISTDITIGGALGALSNNISNQSYNIKLDRILRFINENDLFGINLVNRNYKDKNKYNNNEMSMNDWLLLFFKNIFLINKNSQNIKFDFFDEDSTLIKLGKYS
ncbi:DUF262 domain-containing protein [Vibrio alginolyticus]